jgi:indole-3-glycerol phosphate synthase
MKNILDKIVNKKRLEVERLKNKKSLKLLTDEIVDLIPVESRFSIRLKNQNSLNCIAEIKRRSPSQGILREDFDPLAIAKVYQQLGCAAISVLTEKSYFDGKPEYLQAIKKTVSLPILRKDFIIDSYQIYESVVLGAQAILLIVHILPQAKLAKFITIASQLGLDCLVEIHSTEELSRALDAGATIIGVNNRNLQTFQTDISTSLQVSPLIPRECVRVSESGLKTRDDIIRVDQAGFDAVLIGENFMRSDNITVTYHELFGNLNNAEEER